MSSQKIAINRPLVGILALICLGIAATLLILYPGSDEWNYWQGAFVRVGALMSAFWIALPSRNRDAAWANVSVGTLIGVILAIFGIAYRPRYAIPVIVVVVAIGFLLRPRRKGSSRNSIFRS